MSDGLTLLALVIAAGGAGWVDAVVGGGGLIQTPAFLLAFPSASPAVVIGTTKLPSAAGAAVSIRRYLSAPGTRPRWVAVLIAAGALAGAVGALLATRLPAAVFKPVVLAALVVVLLTVVLRPGLGTARGTAGTLPGGRFLATVAVAGGLGLYDGLIGSGTGTFLALLMCLTLRTDFVSASPYVKGANLGSNVGALVVLAIGGHVLWLVGAAMAVAGMVGAHLGAGYALRHGPARVRWVLIVVATVMLARLALDLAG